MGPVSNAGYGLMFQWTNRATPPKGPIKPSEQTVNDFDLSGFIQTVGDILNGTRPYQNPNTRSRN